MVYGLVELSNAIELLHRGKKCEGIRKFSEQ